VKKILLILGIAVLAAVATVCMFVFLRLNSAERPVSPYQFEDYLYFPSYYEEKEDAIWRIKSDGTEIEQVWSGVWWRFKIFDEKLYILGEKGLYQMQPDGAESRLIVERRFKYGEEKDTIDITFTNISYDGGMIYLYCEAKERRGIVTYDVSSDELSVRFLWERFRPVGWRQMVVRDSSLIYAKHEDYKFYKLKLKTEEEQVLSPDTFEANSIGTPLGFDGKWVTAFFQGFYDGKYYSNARLFINVDGDMRIESPPNFWYLGYNSRGFARYECDDIRGDVVRLDGKYSGAPDGILEVEKMPSMFYLYENHAIYYTKDPLDSDTQYPSDGDTGLGHYYLVNLDTGEEIEFMSDRYFWQGIMPVVGPLYGMD